MARYIEENDIYKLVEPTGKAIIHCSQIDELPRADVVPRSEVEEAKQEVAMSMIDEFENSIEIMHESAKITGNIMFYWEILKAELKKKYIGE